VNGRARWCRGACSCVEELDLRRLRKRQSPKDLSGGEVHGGRGEVKSGVDKWLPAVTIGSWRKTVTSEGRAPGMMANGLV
jgi:hypothetical protein